MSIGEPDCPRIVLGIFPTAQTFLSQLALAFIRLALDSRIGNPVR